MARIIALMGADGSGKTTVAEMLQRHHGFTRLRFADTLKSMLLTLGLSPEEVDGSLKEVPTQLLCGKTPRHAMRTLGTEWGRDMIGENIWVGAFQHRLTQLLASNPDANIVIDDARFPNEMALIKANCGKLWLVKGRERGVVNRRKSPWKRLWYVFFPPKQHLSQVAWRNTIPDATIDNSGQIGMLKIKVERELYGYR
jgi:hypothetical protein